MSDAENCGPWKLVLVGYLHLYFFPPQERGERCRKLRSLKINSCSFHGPRIISAASNVVFRHFFATYLFHRSKNNRRDKLRSKFWQVLVVERNINEDNSCLVSAYLWPSMILWKSLGPRKAIFVNDFMHTFITLTVRSLWPALKPFSIGKLA